MELKDTWEEFLSAVDGGADPMKFACGGERGSERYLLPCPSPPI